MNPAQMTTTQSVDFVYFLIFGISAVMLVGITLTMLYFVVRYHRSRQPKPTSQVRYNVPLEVAWTVIPTIIVLVMFWYGWQGYLALSDVPGDALPVKVTGRMWSWSFEYENGKVSDKLVVPVGRAVRVEITSEDVLHSFFIPAFRVKKDAVPGMSTHLWFRTPEKGSYDIFCAEYCGVGHADMLSTVEAVSAEEFRRWLQQEPEEEDEGRALLKQYGCLGCHSLDGSRGAGPTLQGIWGRQEVVVTDGRQRTLTVDEDYLRTAILQPNTDVVKGFQAVMPSFEGKISEPELATIIDFLRRQQGGEAGAGDSDEARLESGEEAQDEGEVRTPGATKQESENEALEGRKGMGEETVGSGGDGETLAAEKGCLGCHSLDGSRKVGPSFKGLFGREVTVEKNGEELTVSADAEYVRRSITHPGEMIVKGYPAAMPPFADLSDEELQALVDYLKELK